MSAVQAQERAAVACIAAKVEAGLVLAVEVGDCLEWQGKFACNGKTPVVGYYLPEKHRTENAPVARVLWERDHGPVPAGKLVYRKCCNNACVLKEHLACGTRADWAKARKKAGATAHSPATLIALTLAARRRATTTNTVEQARQVRSLAAGRVRVDAIAAITGVHPTMVAEISQGRAWREFAGNLWQGQAA